MRKLEVAVCDICDGYRERFVTYLVEYKSKEMTVQAFSAPELFLEIMTKRKFDIAILGQGFESVLQAVKELRLPCILLKDTMPEAVAEETDYGAEEMAEMTEIFRYQPMERILHEIQTMSGVGLMNVVAGEYCASELEVIGIYSPVRHEMQMPFSMVFSAMLSQRRKVLYVNLMENSGFLELFHLEGQYDMGDIMVRLRNHRLVPETFLRSVYEADGIYYIPPFLNPENLHELTVKDYESFLEFLETKTDFEAVVFDFGEGLMQFTGMLEKCTSIYCLAKSGFFFDCQMNHFLEYLERGEKGNLRERMNVAELPFSARHIRGGTGVLRQLVWSEFGDYVRNYLMGAGYEGQ